MLTNLLMTVLMFTLLGCSSRSFEKDYIAVDASSEEIPLWVEDMDEWHEEYEDKNKKKQRFYFSMTEAHNKRTLACEKAKAMSASIIAAEVSQTISKSVNSHISGDPTTKNNKSLNEYMSVDLKREISSSIVGARTIKTYWEKRRYKKELGAPKNKDAYVCAALIRISKDNLKRAFNRANKKLNAQLSSSKDREEVNKALDKAQQSYLE